MTKKKKIIIATVVAVVLAITIFVVIKVRAKKSLENSNTGNNSSGTGSTTTDNFPLKKRSKGARVKTLQNAANYLNSIPYAPLAVDGIWGTKTEASMLRIFGVNSVNEKQYNAIIDITNIDGINFSPLSQGNINYIKSLA